MQVTHAKNGSVAPLQMIVRIEISKFNIEICAFLFLLHSAVFSDCDPSARSFLRPLGLTKHFW